MKPTKITVHFRRSFVYEGEVWEVTDGSERDRCEIGGGDDDRGENECLARADRSRERADCDPREGVARRVR